MFFPTEFCQIAKRFAFAVDYDIATGFFVALNVETTVTDSDERNELIKVVLDEKNFVIADSELWSVGHQHGFIADRAAKHLNRIRRAGITFNVVRNLKGYVGLNVALAALAFPNRTHISDGSLENEFRLFNELIKSRRNDGRRCHAHKRDADQQKREKLFDFHGLEIFYLRIDTEPFVGNDSV